MDKIHLGSGVNSHPNCGPHCCIHTCRDNVGACTFILKIESCHSILVKQICGTMHSAIERAILMVKVNRQFAMQHN